MSSISYRILKTTPSAPSVTVARQDYWTTVCPPTYINTTINFTLFNYASGLMNVTFYYGCSTNTGANISGLNSTSQFCTKETGDVSVSFVTRNLGFDPVATGVCAAMVIVPVFTTAALGVETNPSTLQSAIDGGFELNLEIDSDQCNKCADSGGRCGINSTTNSGFSCYCRDQAYATICNVTSNPTQAGGVKRLLVIAIVSPTAGLLAVIFVYFLWKKTLRNEGSIGGSMSEANKLRGGKNDTELPLFSLRSILTATNNFSEANKLGEGGFGPVYKGFFTGNEEVAIKRLSKKSGQGHEEFMNELKLIAKLQHTNLVRLLGCCIEDEEMILVYEFMPNRSLDKFLFDPFEKEKLDWGKRFRIIEGIAQGALYIHKYSRLKIIHRDLKASNVLLDGTLNPKISDFGMARIFVMDQMEANTNRVVGTYGYMSPEYALYDHFSEKLDVFSFGVLLLEIVSGKKNSAFYRFEDPFSLAGWAWELWKEGRGMEVIDESIRETCQPDEALRCIHVGILCVQDAPTDRPTMSSVVFMLANVATTLPPINKPVFSANRNSSAVGSSSQKPTSFSNNVVTISLPEAR